MTGNETLREMLDERGVEWEDMSARLPTGMLWCTEWTSQDGEPCTAIEGADDIPDGKLSVQALLTPAQAIAATLGSDRLAFLEEKVRLQGDYIIKLTKEYDALFAQSCEAATRHAGQIDAMQRKLEAATLGAGTCEADETDLIPFVRADSGDLDVDYIHVMECSVCGGTYEHVNGGYEFCPRCGRKMVDE